MKYRGCVIALFAALILALGCGCVTRNTIDLAKRETTINDKNEEVEIRPSRPGYYALVPFAAATDAALLPFYGFYVAMFYAYGGTN